MSDLLQRSRQLRQKLTCTGGFVYNKDATALIEEFEARVAELEIENQKVKASLTQVRSTIAELNATLQEKSQ